MKAEGWYEDPYRIHEDRWYSDGTATSLVRDAGVEAKDPPPAQDPPAGALVRSIPDDPSPGPEDLDRADDPDAGEAPDYSEAALDAFGGVIQPDVGGFVPPR
jgi:hypothetical protein